MGAIRSGPRRVSLPVPATLMQEEEEVAGGEADQLAASVEAWRRLLKSTRDAEEKNEEEEEGEEKMGSGSGRQGEASAASLEELMAELEKWRGTSAADLKLAPSNVISEDLLYKVALVASRSRVSTTYLKDKGVRVEVETLGSMLSAWADRAGLKKKGGNEKWSEAVYKRVGVSDRNPKGGMPTWEKRYNVWQGGKTLQHLAKSGEKEVKVVSVR